MNLLLSSSTPKMGPVHLRYSMETVWSYETFVDVSIHQPTRRHILEGLKFYHSISKSLYVKNATLF